MNDHSTFSQLRAALPFWISLSLIPLAILAAYMGGIWVLLPAAFAPLAFTILDAIFGLNPDSLDPETADSQLFWHKLITIIWFPIQAILIFGMVAFATRTNTLQPIEQIGLFVSVGLITGAIGIVYSHELMHQKGRLERGLADLLLASVLYSHFRSEHLLVHHRYVATPHDAVTARYNEGYYYFFPRVLVQSFKSAWRAEKAMLKRRGFPATHARNPFWRYAILQILFVTTAATIGGWTGVFLFICQSLVAVLYLEAVNYVEHYGLTREHLGDGKYEHTKPRHSWNASHKVTNWLLINLQRHSDHHSKPDRRYPLLQNYTEDEAPQLPFGYPAMLFMVFIPPLFFRVMNPKVRHWRRVHYPEITDWSAYKAGTNPMPK